MNTPHVPRRLSRGIALLLLCFSIILAIPASTLAADPLPKPGGAVCEGWKVDDVRVFWKDNATDETNYRIERKIGNGSWSEIDTVTPNGDGNYSHYYDSGADTSSPNRYYRVRAYRSSDDSYSPYSDVCNNRRIAETDHVRIFYGIDGTDECPSWEGRRVCLTDDTDSGKNIYVTLQETALEGSFDAFNRVGFSKDASTPPSGMDKLPINVVWCDGGGCAGGGGLGLSPFLMEMSFDLDTRAGDPIAWLVGLHEAFHWQQFKYGGLDDPASGWIYEGQARFSQDHLCIGSNRASALCFDDIATGYAGYVPEVKGYLSNTNRPINKTSYQAAMFWTYLTEKFGTSSLSDSVEIGIDFVTEFWEQVEANPGHDGIYAINQTLSSLGHSETFREVWKDFAVAAYAKDISGSGVPSAYQIQDVTQTGGNYGPPMLSLSEALSLGEQVVDTDETVTEWSARYYKVLPAADVPIIDVKFTQDSSFNMFYAVLGIKGNDLTYLYTTEAQDLDVSVVNNSYDEVVVVVAGLEHLANYRYAFNGTQPSLNILAPTSSTRARVGDPSAPDKFLVQVEVVDGSGTPLAGIDISNFTFTVGTANVPAGNILTSAVVQDKYWFVLRAPTQTSAGLYDLTVNYGSGLTDTQNNAVDYSPRTEADNVIIIDRSGSMGGDDKLPSAQDAARLYVDSWQNGDMIGVVSFNSSVSVPLGLTVWTDSPSGGSRQDAFDAINALTATGGTAIGDALRAGWNELIDHGNTSHDWALILLSDGIETAGSESFDTLINALRDTTDKKPQVHAVAVGPDADRLRMQRVSNVTNGTYQAVAINGSSLMLTANGVTQIDSLALDLDSRYRAIATEVLGLQQAFTMVGPLTGDGNDYWDYVTIPVESGAAEMILSLSWDPTTGLVDSGAIVLTDPNGTPVPYTEADSRHKVWRVSNPMGGNWQLYIQTIIINSPIEDNAPTVEYLPDYLVHVSLNSEVTMNAYLTTPVEERTVGTPMGIVVSLTDTGPVTGATVAVTVEDPDGTLRNLNLYDDGAHGDGEANDGIYANTYYQTGEHGSYTVFIDVSGTSSLSGAFTREATLSFYMHSTGDSDGDGLPNEWETRFGTDPDVNDATQNPDFDGWTNWWEWYYGTDPLNPDTDGGGEADDSDANPLDPSDDATMPYLWGQAYPGDSVVYVHFNKADWAYMQMYRSTDINGPYTDIGFADPTTGVFTDTTVTNGTEYCYIFWARDTSFNYTPNASPTCATPNRDPLPPHGYVLINDGAPSTMSTDVTLTLWASDAVDPHNEEAEMHLPPDTSPGGVSDMLISNDPAFSGAAWETYATSKPWTLAQSTGLATVYVRYRDATGNQTPVYAATIWVGEGPGINYTFLPAVNK